jgi:hypothetical protein
MSLPITRFSSLVRIEPTTAVDGNLPLLQHNLADIERNRELVTLASRFVPQSDFQMKNLAPPQR